MNAVPLLAQSADDTVTVAAPPAIEFKAYVEQSRVPLNQKVIFHVELSWIGPLNRYEIQPIEQPVLTNLLMEGSGAANRLIPLENGKYRSVKTITYQFRPMEMGMAYIDGILIRYRDRVTGEEDQLQSQRIMVEIVEPVAEGGKHVRAIIYIVLLGLFFSTVLYFVVQYVRRRRMTEPETRPAMPLAERYLVKIGQEVDPRSTNLAEMTRRLSRIFREYLSREFEFPTLEASTSEILTHLRQKNLDELEVNRLEAVFHKLDEIKFAGRKVEPTEFMEIYGVIEAFLNKRKELWYARRPEVKEV
ncbi:MAG: hypothetical protein GXO78_06250 [Calditrichaeota bacterium]|nr:hypothetical protein [Calditrichota bacterium]